MQNRLKGVLFLLGNQLQAVRQGKWKLHYPHGYRTMAGKQGALEEFLQIIPRLRLNFPF